MVKQRLGTSSLGCLVSVLFVAAVAYFGVSIGNHFFKFYQYQDAMRQEVRFAAHNSDAQMLHNLRDQVDSLGLPESAGEVTIQREVQQAIRKRLRAFSDLRIAKAKPRASGRK